MFFTGRDKIREFLTAKWQKEKNYKLKVLRTSSYRMSTYADGKLSSPCPPIDMHVLGSNQVSQSVSLTS